MRKTDGLTTEARTSRLSDESRQGKVFGGVSCMSCEWKPLELEIMHATRLSPNKVHQLATGCGMVCGVVHNP